MWCGDHALQGLERPGPDPLKSAHGASMRPFLWWVVVVRTDWTEQGSIKGGKRNPVLFSVDDCHVAWLACLSAVLQSSTAPSFNAMPFGQLVIGSPGSGKTTYCDGLHQFLSALGRPISIVNLDPANGRSLPYPCAINIADLITVKDVMREEGLGPNGAMLYCIEYLEENYDWLAARLEALGDDAYVAFDLPGQVELSTNHGSLRRILERLQKRDWRVRVLLCAGERDKRTRRMAINEAAPPPCSSHSWSQYTSSMRHTSQTPHATSRCFCCLCGPCLPSSSRTSMSSARSIFLAMRQPAPSDLEVKVGWATMKTMTKTWRRQAVRDTYKRKSKVPWVAAD